MSKKQTPGSGACANTSIEGLKDLMECTPDVALKACALGTFLDSSKLEARVAYLRKMEENKMAAGERSKELEPIAEECEGQDEDEQEQPKESGRKGADEHDVNPDHRRSDTSEVDQAPDEMLDWCHFDEQLRSRDSVLWRLMRKAAMGLRARSLIAIAQTLFWDRELKSAVFSDRVMNELLPDAQLAVALQRCQVVIDFREKHIPDAARKLLPNFRIEEVDKFFKDLQEAGASLKDFAELASYVRNRLAPETVGLALEPMSDPEDGRKAAEAYNKYSKWISAKTSDKKINQAIESTFACSADVTWESRSRLEVLRATSVAVEKAVKTLKMAKLEEENEHLKKVPQWKKARQDTALDSEEIYLLAQQFKQLYIKKGQY